LESPIRMKEIEKVNAKYTFKPLGLITLTLEWEPLSDQRVEYRIYESVQNDEKKLVGTVTGKGYYEIPFANVFSDATYSVAPYNVQTNEEGKQTSTEKPSLFSAKN